MLIEGLFVPLTTPFDRDGKVYAAKLAANVRRYSQAPVAGLVALTTMAGEGDSLTDDEAQFALKAVGAAASAEKVLVAECTRGSVSATLAMASAAEEARFDVVIVGDSTCAGLSDAQRLLFLESVVDGSPLPVLLQSETGRPLPQAWVRELASQKNVLGMLVEGLDAGILAGLREAAGSMTRPVTVTSTFAAVTRRMARLAGAATLVSPGALAAGTALTGDGGAGIKTRLKNAGFAVLSSGAADGMLTALEAGAAGAVPLMAACAPQACFEIYAAHKDGDPALAAMKQQRVVDADRLLMEAGVAGVKHACDQNAYFGGTPRLPRVPIVADERRRLDEAFAKLPS